VKLTNPVWLPRARNKIKADFQLAIPIVGRTFWCRKKNAWLLQQVAVRNRDSRQHGSYDAQKSLICAA
jgi:hypothetical protein